MLGKTEDLLSKKINRLIEKNQELDMKIRVTKEEIELTREENENLKNQLNVAMPGEMIMDGDSEIFLFIKDFCMIAKKIIEESLFIPYTYETKYSGDFYKIEKNTYEEYVCKLSSFDLKRYMKYCVDLKLVKTENGKSFFNSGGKKVYYVSRAFMDAASNEGSVMDA